MNDNYLERGGSPFASPDPHGHAALTLVESLLHGLMERDLLTRNEAVEIVATASEVHTDLVDADDRGNLAIRQSNGLLTGIAQSLSRDLENVRGGSGAVASEPD